MGKNKVEDPDSDLDMDFGPARTGKGSVFMTEDRDEDAEPIIADPGSGLRC